MPMERTSTSSQAATTGSAANPGRRTAVGSRGAQPISGGDMYTASAAGSDVRRITTDGRQRRHRCGPRPPQLAYAAAVPDPSAVCQLFSGRDDGSAPCRSRKQQAELVAGRGLDRFRRHRRPGLPIDVVHPDGTGLHRVAEFFEAGPLAWSPDGSRIVFTNAVPQRRYLQGARGSRWPTPTARSNDG